MEGKGKRKQLSKDSRLDAALWELAEVLAEIAAKNEQPAGEAVKDQTNDSTNAEEAMAE